MSSEAVDEPHIQMEDGQRLPIRRSCSFGRAQLNTVVLLGNNVSRKHAVIHPQNGGEFWLIDMGSSNGTFLNTRKLRHPTKLSHGDKIAIGDATFGFNCPEEVAERYRTTIAQQTIQRIENISCWLLLADIENFTPLSQVIASETLASLLGRWILNCKDVIERKGGVINKYLGDGFFAFWRDDGVAVEKVIGAIQELRKLQQQRDPAFRIVAHVGRVSIGGVPSMGEESVIGRDVNFLFRLEKLAGTLGNSIVVSANVAAAFRGHLDTRPLGDHAVKGFNEPIAVFAID